MNSSPELRTQVKIARRANREAMEWARAGFAPIGRMFLQSRDSALAAARALKKGDYP